MQGWVNIWKSFKQLKEKNLYYYPYREQSFDKIQHPYLVNALSKPDRSKLPDLDQGHLRKSSANVILNNERSNAFPLKLGTSIIFNTVLGVLASVIIQEKEMNGI